MQMKAMLAPRAGRYCKTEYSSGHKSRVQFALGPNGISVERFGSSMVMFRI